jgi:hypothetical protein
MAPEPKIASGLGVFAAQEAKESPADFSDADSFFNLPEGEDEDEDEEDLRP